MADDTHQTRPTGSLAEAPRSLMGHVGQYARIIVGIFTALVVLWSFYWVGTRPLRRAHELSNRIELTILHWGNRDEDQITQTMVSSFERANPHIKVRRINASADYWTKLQTMVAAGCAPDVMFFNSQQIPAYASKGVLLDFEGFLQEDIEQGRLPFDLNDFYAEALNSFRFDGKTTGRGKLYGLPMSFTPLGFYYNKDLFDKAGVQYPTDDWTWDEFAEKAQAIGRLPGCYGGDLGIHVHAVRTILRTYDADFLTRDFSALRLLDTEVLAVIKRLHFWRFDNPGMLTDPRSPTESGISMFTSGRVGMLGPLGRWVVPDFRKIDKFDWDFAQLPRGTRRANTLYVAAWCIARASPHPREAYALARHFATPECQRINAGLGLALPTLKSVAESDAFMNPAIKPGRDDLYLAAVARSRAIEEPADPKFNAYMGTALDEVLRLDTSTPEQAFEHVQRKWAEEQASPLRRTDYPLMPWRRITEAILAPMGILALVSGIQWWRHRPRRRALLEELAGMGMVSPWVIGFMVFTAAPMVASLLLAFTKWSGMTTLDTAQWVGTGNLNEMLFRDDRLWKSLRVTFYFVVLGVPVGQTAALSVAMLMNNEVRGIGFFRSAWYLPSVLAGVGMAVLWSWVFDAQHGLLNNALNPILGSFGLHAPAWFGADAAIFGVPAFVTMGLWGVGGGMLIYLAGLNAIPQALYEAALIDGAGWWARFRNVTIPMLSPVILFNCVMAIIGSFQVFTQAYIMTGGGPADATLFYVLYLFNQAFQYYEMGYASAMAWFLFVIVLSLTLLVLRYSRRHVHYEGLRV